MDRPRWMPRTMKGHPDKSGGVTRGAERVRRLRLLPSWSQRRSSRPRGNRRSRETERRRMGMPLSSNRTYTTSGMTDLSSGFQPVSPLQCRLGRGRLGHLPKCVAVVGDDLSPRAANPVIPLSAQGRRRRAGTMRLRFLPDVRQRPGSTRPRRRAVVPTGPRVVVQASHSRSHELLPALPKAVMFQPPTNRGRVAGRPRLGSGVANPSRSCGGGRWRTRGR